MVNGTVERLSIITHSIRHDPDADASSVPPIQKHVAKKLSHRGGLSHRNAIRKAIQIQQMQGLSATGACIAVFIIGVTAGPHRRVIRAERTRFC